MTIAEVLKKHSVTQTELSNRFDIPLRTVQNWVSSGKEHRECPGYVVKLIDEALSLSEGFSVANK